MTPDDVARLLDPEVAAALAASPLSFGTLTAAGLAERRAGMAVPQPYEPSGRVAVTEVAVPGAPGDPEVTLRIHRPVELTGPLPCVYWMHGGGLVMGVASREDARFESWCVRHGIVGVSVEYRLAPETPHPGPLEDCHAGLLHIHQRAHDYGVDPSRIGIGGASAGAGLAAGLALLARDRCSVPIAFQVLVYPMIDDRMVTASSAWEVPVWSPASNRFGWSSYLPGLAGTDGVSPYAAAARATDLAGLPPALILVGALDGFLHEDVDYAMRLMGAGVDTELHVYRGAPHGFDLMPGASIAKRARRDAGAWLTAQLDRLASTTP
jgi:acetyl esterase/lipase